MMRNIVCLFGFLVLILSNCSLSADEQPALKKADADKYKISKEAVEKGLNYLVQQQEESGCWKIRKRNLAPPDGMRVGLTSLVLLSFLAEGSTLEKGKYKATVQKAFDFILDSCRKDGAIVNLRGNNHLGRPAENWYNDLQTGLGLLVLTEVYSKTSDKAIKSKIKPRIERAIKYLKKIQLKSGGWDYRVTSDGGRTGITDGTSSDVYTVIPALVAARNAGFEVDPEMIEKGVKCLLKYARDEGSFAYTDNQYINRATEARIPGLRYFRTGAILCTLHKAGKAQIPEFEKAQKYLRGLKEKYLQYDVAAKDVHITYAFLFATFGMKLIGGQDWKDWYKTCQGFLPPQNQLDDGSWAHMGRSGERGNRPVPEQLKKKYRIYATAIATLVLQLPLGNLNNF